MAGPRNKKDSDKPPSIGMNLDTLEREGGPGEDFTFVLKGELYTMRDAQDFPWQDLLAAMQNPIEMFKMVLQDDKRDEFLAEKFESWKLRALMEQYCTHYGIPLPGNLSASPRP